MIAEAFHRTGAVEIWGRGTNRVIKECKAYGIEPPTFEEKQGWVVVTFKAAIGPERRLDTDAQESTQKGAQKSSRKTSEKLVVLIAQNQDITIDEMAKQLLISTRAVKKHLSNLKEKGRIKRVGPDKGGRWEVSG